VRIELPRHRAHLTDDQAGVALRTKRVVRSEEREHDAIRLGPLPVVGEELRPRRLVLPRLANVADDADDLPGN
jgi:hypothetical protein